MTGTSLAVGKFVTIIVVLALVACDGPSIAVPKSPRQRLQSPSTP
jgi:hypothetical protein